MTKIEKNILNITASKKKGEGKIVFCVAMLFFYILILSCTHMKAWGQNIENVKEMPPIDKSKTGESFFLTIPW